MAIDFEAEERMREVECSLSGLDLRGKEGTASEGRSAMTWSSTRRRQERLLQQGLSCILQEVRQELLRLSSACRTARWWRCYLRSAPKVELISSVIISSSRFPKSRFSTSSDTRLRLSSSRATRKAKAKQMALQAVSESSCGSLEGKISLTVSAARAASWWRRREAATAWEMKELSLWSYTCGCLLKLRKMILLVRKSESRERKASGQSSGMAVEKSRQKQTVFSCTEQQNYQQNSQSRMRSFMIFWVGACLAHSALTCCITHSSITYSQGKTLSVRKKLASSSLPISMYHFRVISLQTSKLLFTDRLGKESCAHCTNEKDPSPILISALISRLSREELIRQVMKMLRMRNLLFYGRVRNLRSSVILKTILMRMRVTAATTSERVPMQIQCCSKCVKQPEQSSQYFHWNVLQVREEQKEKIREESFDFYTSAKVAFCCKAEIVMKLSSPLVMPLACKLRMKMPNNVMSSRNPTMATKMQLRRYSLWSLRWQFSQIMLRGSTRHFLTLISLPSKLRFMLRMLYLYSPCTRCARS